MLSSLELIYDTGTKQPGYVIGKWRKISAGTEVKVRIPDLMPDIHENDNEIEVLNPAINIFVNAPECRPKIKKLLWVHNYVWAAMENNCHTKRLPNMKGTRCDVFKEYMTTITLYDGERVNCDFFNRSVFTIDFNSNE